MFAHEMRLVRRKMLVWKAIHCGNTTIRIYIDDRTFPLPDFTQLERWFKLLLDVVLYLIAQDYAQFDLVE